jgi:hypothetical protein
VSATCICVSGVLVLTWNRFAAILAALITNNNSFSGQTDMPMCSSGT